MIYRKIKLRRAKTFSGVVTNLPKQKPDIIKLKCLINLQQLESLGPVFPKMIFLVQNRKNEYQHWIHYIRISLYTKPSLKRQSWFYGPKLSKRDTSSQKQQKWALLLDYWIQDIRIIVMNKFQLQQTRFTQQGRFQSKKVNLCMTIKFNKIAVA